MGKYASHSDNIVVLFLSKFIDKLIKIQQRERIIGQGKILRGRPFLQAGLYLRDSKQINTYPRDGNGVFLPKGVLYIFQSIHMCESFIWIFMNHS